MAVANNGNFTESHVLIEPVSDKLRQETFLKNEKNQMTALGYIVTELMSKLE